MTPILPQRPRIPADTAGLTASPCAGLRPDARERAPRSVARGEPSSRPSGRWPSRFGGAPPRRPDRPARVRAAAGRSADGDRPSHRGLTSHYRVYR